MATATTDPAASNITMGFRDTERMREFKLTPASPIPYVSSRYVQWILFRPKKERKRAQATLFRMRRGGGEGKKKKASRISVDCQGLSDESKLAHILPSRPSSLYTVSAFYEQHSHTRPSSRPGGNGQAHLPSKPAGARVAVFISSFSARSIQDNTSLVSSLEKTAAVKQATHISQEQNKTISTYIHIYVYVYKPVG